MGLFLHKVYRLMSEKGMTYSEACKEIARHGARRRRALRRRGPGKWIPAKSVAPPPISIDSLKKPKPAPDKHFEQTSFDFN